MSYQYNKLITSTIKERKQNPNIFELQHISMSINQIPQYTGQFIYYTNIVELQQKTLQTSQFCNFLFEVLALCHKFDKLLIIEYSAFLQQYLNSGHEFKKRIIVFINATDKQYSLQEFYFQYRYLQKTHNLQLITRTHDIYTFLQHYPFDVVINYYKKSSKYIQTIYLCDLNDNNEAVMPFDGNIFNIKQLHQSIALFYYICKQNFTFIFNFKDNKHIFKQLITRYQTRSIDLIQSILNVYNVILSSVYNDDNLFQAIINKSLQKKETFIQSINQYKTKQALLDFLQNLENQQLYNSLILYSTDWIKTNTPNDVVKYLIASQIPAVLEYANLSIKTNANLHNIQHLHIKQLIKFATPIQQIIQAIYTQNTQQLIIDKQSFLLNITQVSQVLEFFKSHINTSLQRQLHFYTTGQIIRQSVKNINCIELLMTDSDFKLLFKHINKIQNDTFSLLSLNHPIILLFQKDLLNIPIYIYQHTNKNKGLMMVKISSTKPFWSSIVKFAKKKSITINRDNMYINNKQLIINTEQQFFKFIGIKFINPQFRISFQISESYINYS